MNRLGRNRENKKLFKMLSFYEMTCDKNIKSNYCIHIYYYIVSV